MSRIGKLPITVPKGVKISRSGQTLSVKGPLGELSYEMPSTITVEEVDGTLVFSRPDNSRQARALHGTARARVANMVVGCSTGFRRQLDIVGVGYRAAVKGSAIDLTLGFSHPVSYPIPAGVKAEVTKEGSIVLTGADRGLLGSVASDLRGYRPPEPYKGKGVKYTEETILRKEGKARGKK